MSYQAKIWLDQQNRFFFFRFLVERERTGFLDDRSRHVLATNGFASGLCNRAIMTKLKNTRVGTVHRSWAIKYKRAALHCASPGMFYFSL